MIKRSDIRKANHRASVLFFAIVVFIVATFRTSAQTNEVIQPPSELKKLSLEELFDMKVTSVSKKPERLSEVAAAIHVVTDEDIRREGALSIPEALRDIPGVEVARVDSRQYAITARGFNGTAANKLLVMIDGRSVYTPLFSGVFWDAQDTFMEDISRIEVIRGPGATVWGANAVNGVINVLTKSAEETQGLLISGGGGDEEQGFVGARYGGPLGSNAFFRVYGKVFHRDEEVFRSGTNAGDDFRMGQGGFRTDWNVTTENLITFQGDIYTGTVEQRTTNDVELSGGNVLGRWTHTFSDDSDLQVQTYYDRAERNIPPIFGETLDTFDFDLRHRFPLLERHDVVWGVGYRLTDDAVDNSAALAFLPAHLTHHLFTGFVQDEIKLVENRLHLTLGSKLEHNDYTGFEYQPSGRIAWTPAKDHTLWAAASRAVRTPSRIDRDFFVPGSPPFVVLAGGPGFESERLYAFELGYKVQLLTNLNASVATFYNIYDDLRSVETNPPPTILANGLKGETYGVGVECTYQILDWWRWNAGYSFLDLQLHPKPGSTDTSQERQEGDSPKQQFFIKSWIDLPHHVEFDVTVRYVDELPHQMVPAYTALDVRLGWKPTRNLELAIVGQNLLDPQHPEFGLPATREEIQRSIYGKVTCRF
jgi:iron complex outermembrane receptor protein